MGWRIWINRWFLFCVRYSRFFEYILEKHGEKVYNSSIQVYVNKIENRITFQIKKEYSLELLTPDTIKLLGSTKNKITEDYNGENVPHLKIT